MAAGVPKTIGDYRISKKSAMAGWARLPRPRSAHRTRPGHQAPSRRHGEIPRCASASCAKARRRLQLKHGNIVTIFELGDHDGMPFIAMEYVQGQTLAALLKQKPTLLLMRKLR